jgi:hypothetical protein
MTKLKEQLRQQWPMCVEAAADEVIQHLSSETKQQIADTPEINILSLWNRYGQFVRNSLGLWNFYKCREETTRHPDWISLDVISCVRAKLLAKPSQIPARFHGTSK